MKKTFKRLLVLALTLVMVMQMLPGAQAASKKTSGSCGKNVKWSYDTKEKTLTISGKGAMKQYDSWETPWHQNGWNTKMKKLVVKKGVTAISDNAFEGTSLTSVSLPSTLTKIGSYAFFDAELKSITIPKNVKKIGEQVFYANPIKAFKVNKDSKYFSAKDGVLFNKKKTALIAYPEKKTDKSYTIPSTVKTINSRVFFCDEAGIGGNHYLNKLTVPKSVTTIKDSAFEYTSISRIYFKGKAPKFGKDVFWGAFVTIYYPSKYKSNWKNVPDSLEYIGDLADMTENMSVKWKTWKG